MSIQSNNPMRLGYTDSLFPDGSVRRSYSNGVTEKRTVVASGRIHWLDSNRIEGDDIYLGNGQIRREFVDGRVAFGQDLGNGITSWNNGQYVTVNETPLSSPPIVYAPPKPTGFAAFLAGLGLGGFFGLGAMNLGPYGVPLDSPEYMLYAELAQEEELRRRQQQGAESSSWGGGDGGGSDYSSDSFG